MKKSELFATTKNKIDFSIPQTIHVYKAKFDTNTKKPIYEDIEFSYEYKPLINKNQIKELNSLFQENGNLKIFNEFLDNLQHRFYFYFESCTHKVEDAIKNIDLTAKDSLSHYINNEIRLLKEGDFKKHGFVIFKGMDKDMVNKVHLIPAIKHLFSLITNKKDLKDFQDLQKDSTVKNKYSEQMEEIDQIVVNIAYFRTIEYLESRTKIKPKFKNLTELYALAHYIKKQKDKKKDEQLNIPKKDLIKIGNDLGLNGEHFYKKFILINSGKRKIKDIANRDHILEILSGKGNEKYWAYAKEVLKEISNN